MRDDDADDNGAESEACRRACNRRSEARCEIGHSSCSVCASAADIPAGAEADGDEEEDEDGSEEGGADWEAIPKCANAEFSADTPSPPFSESAGRDPKEAIDSFEMKSGKRNENMPKPPGAQSKTNIH